MNYTLAVANAMPDAGYSFQPAKTVMSFGDLMHHVGYGILWWEDNFVKGKKTGWDPPASPGKKEKLIQYLRQSFDSLKTTISKSDLSEEAINGFHATLDHITHHRGQAVLHLRMKDITPPEYVY